MQIIRSAGTSDSRLRSAFVPPYISIVLTFARDSSHFTTWDDTRIAEHEWDKPVEAQDIAWAR